MALIVALTSQQLAVARGQPVGVGEMLFCSEGRLTTVAVDARGQPVGPVRVCPDAVMFFAGFHNPTPVFSFEMLHFRSVGGVSPAPMSLWSVGFNWAQARAPPIAV